MFIESIELQNFRNYPALALEFDPGTNIFYGDNAQGKTNILEAVYLCCTSKSHKSSRDRDMIRFGQDEAHIKLRVRKNQVPVRIDLHLKKNKPKGIAVNGVPIRKASELFGVANVVFFAPEDLNLIKNGPSERRRFIDMELCQLNKLYVHSLVQYNRILNQRNKLLKDLAFHPEYEDTLDVWDLQLSKYGIQVMEFRSNFIEQLNGIIKQIHIGLSGSREELEIFYEPNVRPEDMEDSIKKNRAQDIRQKTTLTGPHRDDIRFSVNGIDIRRFGSQGQQRTAALSLKLSELKLVESMIHDSPILLLDDVLSELDSSRQNHLLSAISDIQTMITCTGLDDFVSNRFKIDKVFKVWSGTAVCEN